MTNKSGKAPIGASIILLVIILSAMMILAGEFVENHGGKLSDKVQSK